MKSINFQQVVDRAKTASVKWDLTKVVFGTEDVLPMWVADMDFKPPFEVHEALQERISHGIYGYTYVPSSVAAIIQKWLENRHKWTIDPSWLLYSTGVVPSISVAIKAFTKPGDKILIQSPVYTPFYDMIKKNDRTILHSPLTLSQSKKQYEIDLKDFEEKLIKGAKLFLLCNPHNPGGRVWSENELRSIADLCLKYNCLILSDEIHSDLVFPPNVHIPIASLDEKYKNQIITFIAPSKTFNLAGLQSSAVIISDEDKREKFKNEQERQGFFTLNTFGIIAMEASYRHGEKWLNELLAYLKENIEITKEFLRVNLPDINLIEPEGTYLLWLDCRQLKLTDEEIKHALLYKGKLALEPGNKYGPGGEGFVRMNIACARETLMDGLNRLKKALN
ncbi:MalY/PatB family protein [Bacillus sp. 31A1R]|uniref:cysteine-S-conjugate beta-lyase n=1 Tax=Robertmurraya mangrovi TaxID=3098077 RepID=A0ABU5IY75_9BACI|nr:MalY/PatB family protein [Bacillus sp. 31A1R]MDZ5472066.1 MalY/PatB family protein [Bacillus sp. 31A1R]